jgi:hypothetical protein
MGWIATPTSLADETVVWSTATTHRQGRARLVGGQFILTETKLIFAPNRLEAATRGQTWAALLSDIAELSVRPARITFPRRQLRIVTSTGEAQRFLVTGVDKMIERLNSALTL